MTQQCPKLPRSIGEFLGEKPKFDRQRTTLSGARLNVTIWRWSTHVQVTAETNDLSGPDCRWLSKALSDAADFKRKHRPEKEKVKRKPKKKVEEHSRGGCRMGVPRPSRVQYPDKPSRGGCR